jgi:hypothetical protein
LEILIYMLHRINPISAILSLSRSKLEQFSQSLLNNSKRLSPTPSSLKFTGAAQRYSDCQQGGAAAACRNEATRYGIIM